MSDIHNNRDEFLNYKFHMTVSELQTCVGLLKENYESDSHYQTLIEIEKLLNLLIEKDPEKKEEYLVDLLEVKYEINHTVFITTHLYADKIHTFALNKIVEEYLENVIPDSYSSVLERYVFE